MTLVRRIRTALGGHLLVGLLICVAPRQVLAQAADAYITEERFSAEGISSATADELELLLYELFARHGRMFGEPSLQAHFASQPWYRPRPGHKVTPEEFTHPEANRYQAITTRLVAVWAGVGSQVTTGALPNANPSTDSDNTYLASDRFEQGAAADAPTLRLLRNEIFARHGQSFESPDLRAYFGAQAWYRERPGHEVGKHELSAAELDVLDRIRSREQELSRVPGKPAESTSLTQLEVRLAEELHRLDESDGVLKSADDAALLYCGRAPKKCELRAVAQSRAPNPQNEFSARRDEQRAWALLSARAGQLSEVKRVGLAVDLKRGPALGPYDFARKAFPVECLQRSVRFAGEVARASSAEVRFVAGDYSQLRVSERDGEAIVGSDLERGNSCLIVADVLRTFEERSESGVVVVVEVKPVLVISKVHSPGISALSFVIFDGKRVELHRERQ